MPAPIGGAFLVQRGEADAVAVEREREGPVGHELQARRDEQADFFGKRRGEDEVRGGGFVGGGGGGEGGCGGEDGGGVGAGWVGVEG